MFFRITVETFEIGQRHFTCVFLLLFFQPGDKHTELCAPVADVVSADNVMAEELQRAHGGIADDGGAQVADMHLFRDVRRGVVDNHGLFRRLSHAQTLRSQRLLNMFSKKCRVEENIDKARTCDFNLAGDAVEIQMSLNIHRNTLRVRRGLTESAPV